MADINDLAEINTLYSELRYTLMVLHEIDAGVSRIDSFLLLLSDGRTLGVDASNLTYPPQMIQNIRQQFEDRHTALTQRLTELGVTGEPSPLPEGPTLPPLGPS